MNKTPSLILAITWCLISAATGLSSENQYTPLGTIADSTSWYKFSFDESNLRPQSEYREHGPAMSKYLIRSTYTQSDFGQCLEISPQHYVCQFVIFCTNSEKFTTCLGGFSFPFPVVMFIYDPNSSLRWGPVESTDKKWINRPGPMGMQAKKNQVIIEFHSSEPFSRNDVCFNVVSMF